MAGWLRERDAILKLSAQSEQLRQRAADRATQIEDFSLRLSGALAAAGAPPQQAAESLASLLARARRLVREAEGRAARRSAFEAVSHARRQLSDKMQKLTEARKSLLAWRGRWAAATRDLVGDRAASPEEISAMLLLLGDIKERIAARQTALHRVEAMAADVAGFNETCAGLAAALLPDFQSAEPVALSRALQAALEQAEAVAVEARRLDGEIRARENELAEETTNLARVRDDLTSLCRQAGCACPAELPDAEDLARRRDTAEHDLEEARKALLAQSEGLDLEQIVAQVCEADLDALDREVADLDRRSADLNEQATELGLAGPRRGGPSARWKPPRVPARLPRSTSPPRPNTSTRSTSMFV
jgi:DNA repair exonuclease SbcCD ATPase subunit